MNFDRGIEKEAHYVDEVILNVDLWTESGETFEKGVTRVIELAKSGSKLSPLATPEERVDFVGKDFTGVHVQPGVVEKYQKADEVSGLMRDHGNNRYRSRDYQGALHYYNLALMFTESNTEAAGLAYANRSAVLVEVGHFEEAIEDIYLAVKNRYPETRLHKLEERRTKCEELLRKKQQEYEALEPQLRKEAEMEMLKMKELRDEFLCVKEQNPSIPGAADFVEIQYDTVQGRHLVVNRDVPAGSLIMVEKPFMLTLDGQSKWDTEHCHNCFKRIWKGIPCEKCVFAIYCQESCRQEAAKIHEYECKCLPVLHAMHAGPEVLLAVRIILKVGKPELVRLFETQDPAYFNPGPTYGKEPNCFYDSQSYLSVFHLVTHSQKLEEWHYGHAISGLIAATILESEVDFFDGVPSDRQPEFKKFVAALMTRHLDAEVVNSAAAAELGGVENISFLDAAVGKIPQGGCSNTIGWPHVFAKGMFPLFSLLNHSCDPNVVYLNHTTDGTMVVLTQRELKKGEQLLVMYAGSFLQMPRSFRQAKLNHQYNFSCRCIACEMNWPTLDKLRPRQPIFCCPSCSRRFSEREKQSREFNKCVLSDPRWRCGSCGRNYDEEDLWRRLDITIGLSDEIGRLHGCNRPLKAFHIFAKVSEQFQYNLRPPYCNHYILEDSYAKVLLLLFHFAQEV